MTTRSIARTGMALVTVAAMAALWSGSVAAQDSPAPSVGTKTYADMKVGFIQTGSESGWRAANTASFKETATQLGIDLHFYDAQSKVENQVSAFHTFNQDPSINVIILAALDTTSYDDVLKEAQAAGKTSSSKTAASTHDPSLYLTYIGSDFDLEGQKAAAAMCTLLKDSAKQERGRDLRSSRRFARHRPCQGLPRDDGRLRHHHRPEPEPDRQLGRARVQGGHGGVPQEDH